MENIYNPDGFEELLEFIRINRGIDFTGYKRSSLQRRVWKRMQALQIENFKDYQKHIESQPDEIIPLFDTILINVTSFFRDPESWKYLTEEILPKILESKARDEPIRAWSAGCASGQEAYTLAMILADIMGVESYCRRVKIYATDADENALNIARRARYTDRDVESVPELYRSGFFVRENHECNFHNLLRRTVIFGRHDLVNDAPISHLDLVLCRNTLMYFNLDAQNRILNGLNFALNDNGHLFLGRAEMLLMHGHLFVPVELKHRIFTKVGRKAMGDVVIPFSSTKNMKKEKDRNKKSLLRDTAFLAAPVAQIVIDTKGELAFSNEQANALFGLDRNDIDKPLKDMELSYRPVELRSLIDQALQNRRSITKEHVERKSPNGESNYLDVAVNPLFHDGIAIGVSITFSDLTNQHRLQENLHRFTENLETAYEELQSANEEMETTNEELQSSNEELETTNEELQAANEEMEMMNAELSSINEDLGSNNQNLQFRRNELDVDNSFLRVILGSLKAGVVVLDRDLKILVWNLPAADMWGMRADEVEGMTLSDLDIGLPIHMLEDPLQKCLTGEELRQFLLLKAVNRKGRLFECRLTITPLLSQEPEEKGVVLVMEEWDRFNLSESGTQLTIEGARDAQSE